MDEQQLMQMLDSIPLDVLQGYVKQRMQQEQTQQGAMPPQEQPSYMSRGGVTRTGVNPYIELYDAPGVPTGVLFPTKSRKKMNKRK